MKTRTPTGKTPKDETVKDEPTSTSSYASESPAAAAEPSPEEALKKLQAERDSLYDQLVRRQADFENYRKRIEREQKDYRQQAEAELVLALLPVLDGFERALNTPIEGPQPEEYRRGVELIYKQLEDTLSRFGLKPFRSVGETFDPFLHHALEKVETSDFRDQEVIEELQRGYMYKQRLLRPALVKVAVRAASPSSESGSE